MRYFIIVVLLSICGNIAQAPCVEYHTYLARITAYNDRSKVNHLGKSIRNSNGCAVPSHTLQNGSIVEIIGKNIRRKVDDVVPDRSVRKHERIADRKGIDIDLVIDLRYHGLSNRQLNKKDLGYQEIRVYQ